MLHEDTEVDLAEELQFTLMELLQGDCEVDELDLDSVCTFEDRFILGGGAGLVIRDNDGNEFQVSIVRSR